MESEPGPQRLSNDRRRIHDQQLVEVLLPLRFTRCFKINPQKMIHFCEGTSPVHLRMAAVAVVPGTVPVLVSVVSSPAISVGTGGYKSPDVGTLGCAVVAPDLYFSAVSFEMMNMSSDISISLAEI